MGQQWLRGYDVDVDEDQYYFREGFNRGYADGYHSRSRYGPLFKWPDTSVGTDKYRSTEESGHRKERGKYAGKTYDSIDSIAEFFKQRAASLGNTSGSFESTRERAEREVSWRKPDRFRFTPYLLPLMLPPNSLPALMFGTPNTGEYRFLDVKVWVNHRS